MPSVDAGMAICKGLLRHPLAFLLLLLLCPRGTPSANPEDNEFAEFEEFDEEEEQKGVPGGSQGAVPLPQKGQEGEDEAAVEVGDLINILDFTSEKKIGDFSMVGLRCEHVSERHDVFLRCVFHVFCWPTLSLHFACKRLHMIANVMQLDA